MFVRGFALFLSIVTFVNLAARPLTGGDCTIWWIDLRMLPFSAAIVIQTLAAISFGLFAYGNVRSPLVRKATSAFLLFLALIAAVNSIVFFKLLASERINASVPVPMTIAVAAMLVYFARHAARPPALMNIPLRRRELIAMSFGLVVAAFSLPVGQMVFFGTTDYRSAGRGDASTTVVVVLGAGVRSDGTPSQALFDRVATACRLYHEGRAATLVFSGGPGPGGTHETDAMRKIAIAKGVPDAAIVLDRDGVSTEATAMNAVRVLQNRDIHRMLAVSHGYHLPRVKLAFTQRGISVHTVPAEQSRTLSAMPYYMLREVPALWVYWLRELEG